MSGTLNNIYNNVSFALYLHSEAMARLQEQVSTGSRINRVSDEPSTAYQILGLNSQVTSLKNYTDNLSQVASTLEIISSVIEDMIPAFSQAKTILTQIVSGIYDEEGRERVAEGINNTLEQIVSLANTEHMNQYLFGGSNTASEPYAVERTDGEITKVTYQGSLEDRNVEVAPGVELSAFYLGTTLFQSNNRSDPIFLGDTGAQAGTGTSSVTGDVWLTVTHNGSNYELSIDDGASTVVVPAGGEANQAVINSETGQVLYVDSTGINSTGVDLVRVPGTYNIFDTLITIRDLLRNDRDLSDAQLEVLRNNALNSLDEMNNLLVQDSVSVGSRIGFLETLKDSIKKIQYDAEDETTRIEEADIAQIAIDLSRREVLYQMSLSIAGKLMSISLLDFIE
jgi:flagellar hook-associated protein 3 FlgL